MMRSSRDCSEAGSDGQLETSTDKEHDRVGQLWEWICQVPGKIDRFIERRNQKDGTISESSFRGILVRAGIIRQHQAQLAEEDIEKLNDLRLISTCCSGCLPLWGGSGCYFTDHRC